MQTLAKRGSEYASEVRRLIDAAIGLMRQCGTRSSPRVTDIVSAAGLSNDTFYRHFRSKDALVVAIIQDGAERLSSYLAHQMAKESRPAEQVARWVAGVLSQAEGETAATTLAVLWNGGAVGNGQASGRHFANEPLAALLHAPLAALGSAEPPLDASLISHSTLGKLSDHLWQRTSPSRAEVDHIADFYIRAILAARSPARHGPARSEGGGAK